MLTLDVEEFLLQVKDGSFHNVGAPNKRATVKLYDVVDAEAREFGDERVKFVFEDDDGNAVEVALDPDTASKLADDVTALEESSRVFE